MYLSMLNKIYLCLVLSCILALSAGQRKILFSSFPGSDSRNEVMISIANKIAEDPQYKCYGLLHYSDYHIWRHTNCKLIIYGNKTEYLNVVYESEKAVSESFMNGFQSFKNMIDKIMRDFREDMALERIEEIGIDMMFCDIWSYPCLLASQHLNISRHITLNPVCAGNILNLMETHPSYIPTFNTQYSTEMTFAERFINVVNTYIMKTFMVEFWELIHKKFMAIDRDHWANKYILRADGLFMQQCVPGFNYAEYKPPNSIDVGYIGAKASRDITDNIDHFTSLYDKIIYISIGTNEGFSDFNLENLVYSFEQLSNIGFILKIGERNDRNITFSKNVLTVVNPPEEIILESNKTILYVTHGGWNSILRGLNHGIPLLVFGWAYDRGTHARLVEYRGVGEIILTQKEATPNNIFAKIQKLINTNKYATNAEKISRVIRAKDSRAFIKDWVDFYFDFGVDNLIVKSFYQKGTIEYYNIDVICVIALVHILLLWMLKKVIVKCCVGKRKVKTE